MVRGGQGGIGRGAGSMQYRVNISQSADQLCRELLPVSDEYMSK